MTKYAQEYNKYFMKKILILISFVMFASFVKGQNTKLIFLAYHPSVEFDEYSLGHVWVKLVNPSMAKAVGYYPDGLRNEKATNHDVKYSFTVDDYLVPDLIAIFKQHDDHGELYRLGRYDCRYFAKTVAEAAGLEVPRPGTSSPAEWLAELVDLN